MNATYTQIGNIAMFYIIVMLVSFTNLYFSEFKLNIRVNAILVKKIKSSIACVLNHTAPNYYKAVSCLHRFLGSLFNSE